MGLIQLAKGWSLKPSLGTQINPAHPLAQGLLRAYLFNEGGGRPNDLVRGRPAADAGPANTWAMGPNGPTLAFSPAASNWVWDADATTLGPFTLVIKCLWDGSAHASQYFWLFNHWWAIYVNSPAGAGGLNFVRNWSTNYDAVSFSTYFSDSSNANKWFHLVWISPGIVGGHILYTNGVPKQGTVNGSGTPTDMNEFTIGAYDNAGSSAGPWAGEIDHVLLYNRALTPAEVRMLYADNFCFMQPQSPK